jgi:hypothetical protein
MKRFACYLLSALTLLQPLAAVAATDPPLCGSANPPAGCEPYQSFRTSSRYKRVAIIRPSRWDVISQTSLDDIRRNVTFGIGNIKDQMQIAGLEVHEYDTAFFESNQDHREMWTDFGAKYALAIVLSPQTSVAGFARYICADSTNVQVVVVGGGGVTWAGDSTTLRGHMDDTDTDFTGTGSLRGSCLVTPDGLDTLWVVNCNSGRRKATLESGVASVVRVLVPQTTSGVHWLNTGQTSNAPGGPPHFDSTTTNMPTSSVDTVAASAGLLGPLWKVNFDHYSGEGDATWINSLAAVARGANDGGGSPRSVYWLKLNPATNTPATHLLWSLICRFTTADPIRWAFDMDDVVDQFSNGADGSRTLGFRWRPTQADTAMRALAVYGIRPTTMVNPGHMAAYLNGTTPYFFKSGADIAAADSSTRRESYWITEPANYLKNMTWVHHSHDSTSESIASGLVGAYGGYSTGNNNAVTENAGVTPVSNQIWNYRLAGTWQPSGDRTTGKWGIVQRYLWSDSVRKSIAPSMISPPYLAFPANQMLPKNWRARTLINAWNTKQSLSASCPIDSVLWAYDYGLNHAQASGLGQIWLRFVADDVRGSVVSSGTIVEAGGIHYQWDRDSCVASSLFLYPNERIVRRVGGRLVQATGVHSFLQGASSRTGYMDASFARLNKLLGLKNPVRFSDVNNAMVGETAGGDAMGVMLNGAEGIHDFSGRQATRVVYIHPGQQPGIVSPNGGYDVDVCVQTYFSPMRMMDKIAGRPTQRCVPAWQVYAQK